MKQSLTMIHTCPAEVPGSMPAYASLVLDALKTQNCDDFDIRHCRLHAPDPKASMWQHHVWRLRHARATLGRMPSDLYHLLDGSMAMFVPRAVRSRSLVTVHDLIPLLQIRKRLPGRQSLPARWLALRSARALRHYLGVAADSECTRRDLECHFKVATSAIIPLAVRPLPEHPQGEAAVGMGKDRFLLHVGSNAPYKNRVGVLEVFRRLSDIPDLRLIMAGPQPTPELRRRAQSLRNVLFRENVSDAELACLYRGAALLLFPSLYEGFGMPVLEAMSVGCPVVCSTNGSLPEVAGDAALTAPAEDVAGLAAHCRNLLENPELSAGMKRKGRERAAGFSLRRMGAELIGWYGGNAESPERRRRAETLKR